MFAGLFTKVGLYLIGALIFIAIIAAGYGYIEHERSQISTLEANVSTYKASNDALQTQVNVLIQDMASVKKAQDQATKDISNAAQQAALAQQAIKSQNLNKAAKTNSTALAKQLNDSTVTIFKGWEDISK
jgi:hypothetical protein